MSESVVTAAESQRPGYGSVGFDEVELVRHEPATGPLAHRTMFRIMRIIPCLKKVGVSDGSPSVLGRTMAFTADTGGIGRARLAPDLSLDFDLVLPAIAEIVPVEDGQIRHVVEIKIAQTDL